MEISYRGGFFNIHVAVSVVPAFIGMWQCSNHVIILRLRRNVQLDHFLLGDNVTVEPDSAVVLKLETISQVHESEYFTRTFQCNRNSSNINITEAINGRFESRIDICQDTFKECI
ncbi:hypothetical protein RF11_11942 [Thelohanellus kitauei]|uniref:Uncharacterized protein n=1 Tax=Thelohanellus kitauei TaxID=669202 RepID=A0A0C2MG46_THEKT|nr:hypothetical protein RF11_11942 [Thelohanellus kitauei]